MKVTFPQMGNAYIAVKVLFDGLGIDYVVPKPNNRLSLQTGAYYSPEEICLPFKITMGNYLECIERGADTIVITGSCGPCRFGEYCELQMNILKKLGKKVDFIVLDSYTDIGRKEFFKRIGRLSGQSRLNKFQKLKALKDALKALDLIEKAEASARYLAGYEVSKGECKRLLNQCKAEVMKCGTPGESIKILKDYKEKIDSVKTDRTKDPLKIALIGEIYTMIEPFSNLYIEEKLMDYGVCVTRHLNLSWWVRDLLLKPLKLNSLDIKLQSKKYLPFNIGGHGRESVAHAVRAKQEKMDGTIQILPLGCMPEIVSKGIMPAIQKDKDLPVMTLIVDEMTGEAGYVTRIEAFLDMLESRKKGAEEPWKKVTA